MNQSPNIGTQIAITKGGHESPKKVKIKVD